MPSKVDTVVLPIAACDIVSCRLALNEEDMVDSIRSGTLPYKYSMPQLEGASYLQ